MQMVNHPVDRFAADNFFNIDLSFSGPTIRSVLMIYHHRGPAQYYVKYREILLTTRPRTKEI